MFNTEILKNIDLSNEDLYYVSNLVREAGFKAKSIYETGELDVQFKESNDDLVTFADKELNNYLVDGIKTHFSLDGILSEEVVNEINTCNYNRIWVIDPIDGTDNYVHNDGQYSVMIGLLIENTPVAGWVYSPVRDELYLGIPGNGIYKRIGTGHFQLINLNIEKRKLNQSLRVMIGRRDLRKNPSSAQKLKDAEFIQMGSLGLKVIEIIEDRADIFIHTIKKLKIWDTVAPSAIGMACNMHISTLEGNKFLFNAQELAQDQTYIIGRNWAFKEVEGLLKL